MEKSQKIAKKQKEQEEIVGQTQNSSRSHVTTVSSEADKKPKFQSKLRSPTKVKRRSRQPESPPKVVTAETTTNLQSRKFKMQPEVCLVSIDSETDQVTSSEREITNTKSKIPVIEIIDESTNGVQNGSEDKTSDSKKNGVLNETESQSSHKTKSESSSKNHTKAEEEKKEAEEKKDEEVVEVKENTPDIVLAVDDEESPQKLETAEARKEVSFVTYDASSMLKEPSAQVNDTVKDNFAIAKESNELEKPKSGETFGETLKKISGRRSLTRNVTLRDAMSPNSSMFVNVSMTSPPDYRILHHREGLGTPTNGGSSVSSRKRKLSPECITPLGKKTKTEGGFLNRSFDYIFGTRNSSWEEASTSKTESNSSLDTKDKGEKKPWRRPSCTIM